MQRPTSVTVLGVLNLVFGVWGALGIVIGGVAMIAFSGNPQVQMFPAADHPFMRIWTFISFPLGLISSIALTAAGVGMLRMRPWGRKLSLYYAMYALVMGLFSMAIQAYFVLPYFFEQFEQRTPGTPAVVVYASGAIGGLCGGIISLGYPALLWFYMTRPHVVAAFAGNWRPASPVSNELTAQWQASVAAHAATGDNPYAAPQAAPAVYGDSLVEAMPASESAIHRIVPAKNGAALVSYYTGLFSLFPCLGLPLAVVAIYYGFRGLANFQANPAVYGKVHAHVGLICGIIFGLFNLLLVVAAIVGIVASMR